MTCVENCPVRTSTDPNRQGVISFTPRDAPCARKRDVSILLIILCLMNITTHYQSPFSTGSLETGFPAQSAVAGVLIRFKTVPAGCLAVVDLEQVASALEESPERLSSVVLTPAEQKIFTGFRYSKRRCEWLGGRLAVKAAWLYITGREPSPEAMQALGVLPDSHGRPLPAHNGDRDLSISISHSSGFGVGMASTALSCGVDIQEISTRLQRLTSRFAGQGELALLHDTLAAQAEDTRLTMLWAAKEAIKKSLLHDQPSIFSGIRLVEIRVRNRDGCTFTCTVNNSTRATVFIGIHFPYILAHTTSHAGTA